MLPLRLTWELASPVACTGYPIHLDDLVAFAKTQIGLRMAEQLGPDAQTGSIRRFAQTLPLERESRDGEWVWKASALVPVDQDLGASRGMRFWTRRTDPFDYANRFDQGGLALRGKPGALKPYALKIDTARGLLKNGYKFYSVKHVTAMQAWCIGDPDELAELLDPGQGSPVAWIGARGRSGLGRIKSFSMVEDPQAHQCWFKRSMPWPYDDAVPMELSVRPPYWDRENARQAWINPSLFM